MGHVSSKSGMRLSVDCLTLKIMSRPIVLRTHIILVEFSVNSPTVLFLIDRSSGLSQERSIEGAFLHIIAKHFSV